MTTKDIAARYADQIHRVVVGQDETVRLSVTTCDPGQHGAYRLSIYQAPTKNGPEEKK